MKALVIGTVGNESHDQSVRTYFLAINSSWTCHIAEIGSGVPSGNIVTYQTDVAGCVAYAIANGYKIIIRSYTGIYSFKAEFDEANDNGILVYNAHGSNTHILLATPPRMFGTFAIGGGKNNINERSYGKMESFDKTAGDLTEESWATPTYAGRGALSIDLYPLDNIWDTRQRQRQTDSFYNTNWIEDGGYGQGSASLPSVSALQLDLAPPIETYGALTANNRGVYFFWENYLQTRWSKTRIVQVSTGLTIYEGTGTSYTWNSNVSGSETFKFYSVDTQGNISRDESYTQTTITGLEASQITTPIFTATESGSQLQLSWDAIINTLNYQLERKHPNANWQTLGNLYSTQHIDSPTFSNTTYNYRLKAIGANGYLDSEYAYINIRTSNFAGQPQAMIEQQSKQPLSNSVRFGDQQRFNEFYFGQPEGSYKTLEKYMPRFIK